MVHLKCCQEELLAGSGFACTWKHKEEDIEGGGGSNQDTKENNI